MEARTALFEHELLILAREGWKKSPLLCCNGCLGSGRGGGLSLCVSEERLVKRRSLKKEKSSAFYESLGLLVRAELRGLRARAGAFAMAAHLAPPSEYSPQAESGSSQRGSDSPLPASEEDPAGHVSLPDPAWTEERFRVDRKKLETMLLGRYD